MSARTDNTSEAAQPPVVRRRCVNHRQARGGCVGRVVPEWCRYRAVPGGPIAMRLCLVCDKCGQAHGPA